MSENTIKHGTNEGLQKKKGSPYHFVEMESAREMEM
jgi:hypothetical protein